MMTINTLIKTYRSLIISGAILLFCAIGVIIGVIPAVIKVQALIKKSQILSDQGKVLQKKLTILRGLDEETLREQLAIVISAVPSDKALPTIFSTLEGVAAQSGVSVSSINIGSGDTSLSTPSATKQTAQDKQLGTRTTSFSITIRGTLDSIVRFITLAPQVRRLMRIRTFAISFLAGDQPVSISLEMDAFYQPMPNAVGTAAAVLPTLTDSEREIISKISQLTLVTGNDISLPPPSIGQVKVNPFSP